MDFIRNWSHYNAIKKKKYYFFFFSLFFLLIALCCFGYFAFYKKSFFWIGGGKDGLTQNYNCLVYFSNHLRTIVKNIFIDHTFIIPQWDFGIGYGADVMTSMSIMTGGDIFNWFSIFVPEQFIKLFYHVMAFVRLYLAGAAFSCFCFRLKQRYSYTFIGVFIYMFCGYVLISLPRQVVFINPMIWLPLLLIGVEKILHNEKPYMFIFAIFVSIIGSFQYFYILCISVFIYTVVRFFCLFKTNYIKNMLCYLTKFIFYTLVGVLLGSIVFIPVILRFLSDARSSSGIELSLFYPMSYYKLLPASFISYQFPGGDWTFLTLPPIVFISSIVLFASRWKKNISLKILFLIALLFTLSPLGGLIMNGFSFSSNRWIFVFIFILSTTFVFVGNQLLKLSRQQILVSFFATLCYIIYCINILGTRINYTMVPLIILFTNIVFLLVIFFDNKRKSRRISHNIRLLLLFIFCLSGLISNAYFINSSDYKEYTSEFLSYKSSEDVLRNTGIKAIKELGDNQFYRYEDWNYSNKSFYNSGLNYGIGGPNYFFSLSNSYSQDYYNLMNVGDGSLLFLQGLDSRSILYSLANVKYISITDELQNIIPKDGYKLVQSSGENNLNVNIYENKNMLPFGYTYQDSISESDFRKMSFIDRQEVMLDKIVLKSGSTNVDSYYNKSFDFKVSADKTLEFNDKKIKVNKKNSKLSLIIPEDVNCDELYVTFKNFSFSSIKQNYYSLKSNRKTIEGKTYHRFWQPTKSSFITVEGQCKKGFTLRSQEDIYFNPEKRDFSVNVQSIKKDNQIDIYFTEVGEYSFDDITVQPVMINDFEEKIERLKENKLENIVFATNSVKGNIKVDTNKTLCLSIPYTDGWQVYVDGKKTEILQGNIMYIAINLTPGEHTIELHYNTPGLRIGSIFSVSGLFLLGALYYIERKK